MDVYGRKLPMRAVLDQQEELVFGINILVHLWIHIVRGFKTKLLVTVSILPRTLSVERCFIRVRSIYLAISDQT